MDTKSLGRGDHAMMSPKVYCHCRRLEEGDMIECSKYCHEWYHRECCNVDAKYFEESEDTEWSCMSCA